MRIEEELYQIYPRHIGKWEAFRSIRKALNRLPLELRMEGQEVNDINAWIKEKTAQFANSPSGQRGLYTPHPSTWFNQSRYLDDENEWYKISPKEEENMRMAAAASVGVWRPH